MAKRESIWKANDGTEHRSKQSAAVADAEEAIRVFVKEYADDDVDGASFVTATTIIANALVLAELFADLIKARAALAKHEARGEK